VSKTRRAVVAEFLSWPGGSGPNLIQFLLIFAGVFAGVRITEDVKAWRAARAKRAADRPG
jgi:hypothetical protein